MIFNRNKIFKWFLSYSKKLGYDVSITKETEESTEYYCNYVIPVEPTIEEPLNTPEIKKKPPKRKLNNPINYLKTEELDLNNGRGSAKIIQKKINEIINAVNYMNNNIS